MINILLTPAVRLLNRFRFPMKFALIFVAVLIPLVLLSALTLQQLNEEIRFLENERDGVRYIQGVRAPIDRMQQHRGLMATLLAGDATIRDQAVSLRGQVGDSLAVLANLDGELGDSLATRGRVSNIRQQWEELAARAETLTAAQSFEEHTLLISELISLVRHVADTSEITLDPSLDTYYLGDALVNNLPNLVESMGQVRALASEVATVGAVGQTQRIRLEVLLASMETYLGALSEGLDAAMQYNPELVRSLGGAVQENHQAVESLTSMIRNQLLDSMFIMIDGAAVFETATHSINTSYALFDRVIPTMDGILADRVRADLGMRNLALLVVVLVLIGLMYLFAALYRSISESVDRISEVARKVADGDLTQRVTLDTRDEIHYIADSFNAMSAQFEQLIQEIVQATTQLASAAEEMSGVARHSAHNIQQQHSETDQVATAMNEMSATVQEVSGSAGNASSAARDTDEQAKRGSSVVGKAARSISDLAGEIDRSSEGVQRVSKDSEAITSVLDVIKGIAEQTNLLALNAAIEAARAGEQGRGFAVVADEVRTLASRTQQSASEIGDMIDHLHDGVDEAVQMMDRSREHAHKGVALVQEAAEALDAITGAVTTVSDMNTHIATAVEQQSATTEEINRNITSIRGLAEQSAAGAEQATVATDQLARLATELQGQTGRFKVGAA